MIAKERQRFRVKLTQGQDLGVHLPTIAREVYSDESPTMHSAAGSPDQHGEAWIADQMSNHLPDGAISRLLRFQRRDVALDLFTSRRRLLLERLRRHWILRQRPRELRMHRHDRRLRIEAHHQCRPIADLQPGGESHRRIQIQTPGALIADQRLAEWFAIQGAPDRNRALDPAGAFEDRGEDGLRQADVGVDVEDPDLLDEGALIWARA